MIILRSEVRYESIKQRDTLNRWKMNNSLMNKGYRQGRDSDREGQSPSFLSVMHNNASKVKRNLSPGQLPSSSLVLDSRKQSEFDLPTTRILGQNNVKPPLKMQQYSVERINLQKPFIGRSTALGTGKFPQRNILGGHDPQPHDRLSQRQNSTGSGSIQTPQLYSRK